MTGVGAGGTGIRGGLAEESDARGDGEEEAAVDEGAGLGEGGEEEGEERRAAEREEEEGARTGGEERRPHAVIFVAGMGAWRLERRTPLDT